jgi:hypothetical protein
LPPKLPRKASNGSGILSGKQPSPPTVAGNNATVGSSAGSLGFISTPTNRSVMSAKGSLEGGEKNGKRKRRKYLKDERWAGIQHMFVVIHSSFPLIFLHRANPTFLLLSIGNQSHFLHSSIHLRP